MHPVLTISPKAWKAIEDLKARLRAKLNSCVVLKSPGFYDRISEEYSRELARILRDGLRETRNDRPVRVKCPTCEREETIAGDVMRYACVCSPSVQQYAFKNYVNELKEFTWKQ